mmetsp:Transcript_8545/g.24352  ORF Transcript_8545/g.24352 Transcript_8545/m.24352 type:complete len:480 (-) Transcript_8545:65-1504(-)
MATRRAAAKRGGGGGGNGNGGGSSSNNDAQGRAGAAGHRGGAAAESVFERSNREAWQPPTRALFAALLLPTAVMMARVGSMHHWIAVQLGVCTAVSVAAFLITLRMIPLVAPKLAPKLHGVDLGKRGLGGPNDGKALPESLGIVSGTVFMMSIGVLQFTFGASNDQLLEYNAALLSICFAVLLGLVDDVIDIKWKHKLVIGVVMALPLLLSYKGGTTVLMPRALAPYLANDSSLAAALNIIPTVSVHPSGDILDLGFLYYVYMASLVVFCTNAVNIYAGINGLEVGQSIVAAASITVVNLQDIEWRGGKAEDILTGDGRNHLFSLMVLLPFIATAAALMRFNFYPAQVFIGDVFPYYAGMTIAVAAILGHFSKSLLLLIIPQVINFVYSVPQLFHLIPIPRHRLPRLDQATGLMHASKVAPGDDRNNKTLICAALGLFGPMHERTLCILLLAFQALCSVVGIAVRGSLSTAVFARPDAY